MNIITECVWNHSGIFPYQKIPDAQKEKVNARHKATEYQLLNYMLDYIKHYAKFTQSGPLGVLTRCFRTLKTSYESISFYEGNIEISPLKTKKILGAMADTCVNWDQLSVAVIFKTILTVTLVFHAYIDLLLFLYCPTPPLSQIFMDRTFIPLVNLCDTVREACDENKMEKDWSTALLVSAKCLNISMNLVTIYVSSPVFTALKLAAICVLCLKPLLKEEDE